MSAHALIRTASNAPAPTAQEPVVLKLLGERDRVLYGFLVKAGAVEPATAAARSHGFYRTKAHPWRAAA